STDRTVITVDLSNTSQDLTVYDTGLDSEYFVIGDTAHTPLEIEVVPMTIKGKITCLMLLTHRMHPPFYLVKGHILAQAIPVSAEIIADGKSLEVYWAEVVGENRPSLACNLACGSDRLHVEGVLETRPDEDKVQRMPPWKYLGLEITARTVVPQKLEIQCNLKTLADLHSLCGSLNWVRPWLGLTNEDLAPLFNLLKEERELVSPRELTPEAKTAIEKVQKAFSESQAHWCEPNMPFHFIVLGKLPHLHGLIFQWIKGQRDSLLIIEWVFLFHQRSKTITEPQELIAQLIRKARVRLCELAGFDFTCIHLLVKLSEEGRNSPERLTKEMFEHLLWGNASLQLSLASYRGQISVHAPSHKLFNEEFHLIPREKRSRRPLKALTVYTDASRASHKSVMTWRNPQTQHWEADVEFVEGSPQVAELAAVVRAFEKFSEPINLAKLSHQQYHQNVPGLIRQFRAIVATCPSSRPYHRWAWGVNPRGLGSCEVWQTDITHIPSFGRLKYDHVSIDTYSGAIYASAHTEEKSAHAKQHLVQAFSVLGIPKEIKTYKGPAYVSKEFLEFIQQWGVERKSGIPRSPTEKTYLTLNPVMNPIQVAILLMLNGLAAAWIVPQLCQNVWVTLAQTLQQENICLSTAVAKNPMSTYLRENAAAKARKLKGKKIQGDRQEFRLDF
ncbi:hypothetical protein HGM15179_021387, partial [Zosterops borbonicus]